MELKKKPKIFVGSSSSKESLDISYAIQQNLERDADITVWTQGIFQPSRTSLDSLLTALDNNDFGIFVFTGDDLIIIRDVEKRVARDNVVFELGLFIGRLGQEKSFIIKPRGEELHLPTDIMGLTPLDFPTDRDDKNLEAALGPACHSIRRILKDSSDNYQSEDDSDTTSEEEKATEGDSIVILTSWLKQNIGSIIHVALFYRKLDNDLKLYPGTSKTHIKQIAEKMKLIVEEESENTIMFNRGPMRVITKGSGRRFGEW